MKSIWKGAINFGLVNIPVNLYLAVEESSLDLDMLDKRDHSNIKFKRVNASTGKEVPKNDIIKSYLYNDKYVDLADDDFKAADTKKSETIEILHFVEEVDIPSIYYERPYYLEPQKTGVKAYGILRDALYQSGKVGVTTFVLRNKEALAILKPYKEAILLNRIRFEEEIRDMKTLDLPPITKSKPKEQLMANKLIEQSTEHFDISNYKDTYTAKLLSLIKQKAKTGRKPKTPALKVVHRQSEGDLMEMLKASLGGVKKKRA